MMPKASANFKPRVAATLGPVSETNNAESVRAVRAVTPSELKSLIKPKPRVVATLG